MADPEYQYKPGPHEMIVGVNKSLNTEANRQALTPAVRNEVQKRLAHNKIRTVRKSQPASESSGHFGQLQQMVTDIFTADIRPGNVYWEKTRNTDIMHDPEGYLNPLLQFLMGRYIIHARDPERNYGVKDRGTLRHGRGIDIDDVVLVVSTDPPIQERWELQTGVSAITARLGIVAALNGKEIRDRELMDYRRIQSLVVLDPTALHRAVITNEDMVPSLYNVVQLGNILIPKLVDISSRNT